MVDAAASGAGLETTPEPHSAEHPADRAAGQHRRRRFDPWSLASRWWASFAIFVVLSSLDATPWLASISSVWGDNVIAIAAVDVSLLAFLVLTYVHFRREPPDRIRARAAAYHARRTGGRLRFLRFPKRIPLVVFVAWTGVGTAAFDLPHAEQLAPRAPGLFVGFAAARVIIVWFVVHAVYAEHYALKYYTDGGGLDFSGEPAPTYGDFAYFSYSIGMTFGTTDVDVTRTSFRRVMVPHALLSFGFNTVILALVFTILFD